MLKEAVILAAGKGKRLRPFTDDMPKVMLPIANKPILEYVLNALIENGINKVVIVVGYKKESVMEYFENGKKWGIDIQYAFQEKQLGTGHALLQAEKYIESDEFLVLPGDNIIDKYSISELIRSKAPSVIVEESKNPSKYGVIEIEKDRIKIIEKPKIAGSNLVSTGIYKFKKNVFEMIKNFVEEGKNDLTYVVGKLMMEEFYWIKGNGKWKDALYPWDLLEMNGGALQNLKNGIAGHIDKNVIIKGDVFIGKDSIIHPGCYIKGPVIIGEGCEIGPNTYIFPSTSIGNNVTIYPSSEIRNSIIMDGTTIGSNSFISNSVIGRGNHILSHFSIEVENSVIEIEGEFHKVDKIGAFIGSDCNIGSHVIVKSGKLIGKNCSIAHQKIINKDLPNNSLVM